MKISQILDQKPVNAVSWIAPNRTITDALAQLADKGIGTLIVSQEGSSASGILSERDIVRALAKDGPTIMKGHVNAIMTPNPVCCGPDDDSNSVLNKMTEGRFRHMPVTDEKGGLIGVVSIGDIVKARITDLEFERSAMVDMIAGR